MRPRNRVGGRLERTSYMSSYVSEEMEEELRRVAASRLGAGQRVNLRSPGQWKGAVVTSQSSGRLQLAISFSSLSL